jgi:hypothetical protein
MFVTGLIKAIFNKINYTNMKKILFTICVLLSVSLSAQQLYFISAFAGLEFEFYEPPPVQIIAYTPDQDTILQIYKDYSDVLNQRIKPIYQVIYYPKFKTFCFNLYNFSTYMLNTSNIDTIVKMETQCPRNYKVSPFLSMNIINDLWAYRCTNTKASDEDYAVFKGIDMSLSKYFDLKAADFKDLHLTGVICQRIALKPNDSHMYLPIVADMENRPPFSVELPQQYWVRKESYSVVLVNDDTQTLLLVKSQIPTKEEDYGHFYTALYNKQKNSWSDVELKGNAPTIMAYGHWLAGSVQDDVDYDAKYFPRKLSPGKAVRDSVYMECPFEEWGVYRPGILYLFNTDTEKYIEWNTGQGDSEILLVQDEVVYYRVFDEIYKASIEKGEKLGKSELLVKDNQVVPYIHWAFLRQE